MGPNGTGKSTLGYAITGNPVYTVTDGDILLDSESILDLTVDERAKKGIFLPFQNPLEVPGVTLSAFIRSALEQKTGKRVRLWEFKKKLSETMKLLNMDESYAERDLNVGFSGGEKKKAEILQMLMLEPKLAILDETDYTVSWAKGNDNYITPWNDSNNNPTRFKITGANGKPITVKPGDSYYATYTVTVKPEALAAMKANNVDVKNRYYVYASNAVNTNSNFGGALDRVYDSANVGNYKWDEKTVGTGTAANQTIEMGTGDRYEYDLTSGTVKPDSSADTFFTVPAGSYPYTVDVNQTLGEWNATNVLMKDELIPSDKMQYIGYVKVDACEYNVNTNKYDVKGTKWVKIAGLSSFALKPSDLGWENANYAYKFTYYAMPHRKKYNN